MNQREARNTIQAFYRNDNPTKDDEFVYTEALKYLIDTEGDANTTEEYHQKIRKQFSGYKT